LPSDMDDLKLTRMFMAFGPVSSVKIMQACVWLCCIAAMPIRFECS
jgi:hypothetical protein